MNRVCGVGPLADVRLDLPSARFEEGGIAFTEFSS